MAKAITMLQANNSLLDSNLLIGRKFDGAEFKKILEKNAGLLDTSYCNGYVAVPKDDKLDLFKKYCGLQF